MSMILYKLKILLFFVFSSLVLSQSNRDIYLEIPCVTHFFKDKKGIVEVYKLNSDNCNNLSINYKIDENNKLIKTVTIKSIPKTTLIFTYSSYQNIKKKFYWNQELNFISYKELIRTDLNCLKEVLKKYNNIFIVDKKKYARKVSFEYLESL